MSVKVWLITELMETEYSADRSQCWLKALTHNGQVVSLAGIAEQQINILSLKAQQLPCAVMADNVIALNALIQIPHTAMLGILPVPAEGLQGLIDSGQAEAWLAKQTG